MDRFLEDSVAAAWWPVKEGSDPSVNASDRKCQSSANCSPILRKKRYQPQSGKVFDPYAMDLLPRSAELRRRWDAGEELLCEEPMVHVSQPILHKDTPPEKARYPPCSIRALLSKKMSFLTPLLFCSFTMFYIAQLGQDWQDVD